CGQGTNVPPWTF
nr:immunoglobulin light chain junction region [Macaca mulatta]